MSYIKGAPMGNVGNARLLKQYGGGSSGSKHSEMKGYATGGAVKDGNPSLSEGLSAAGGPSKPNLARPGRKMPGKKAAGKGKTNINVVVMQKPDATAGAGAGPGGPMMPMPGGPGPGPMPDAGGPPPPMRKHGGRVHMKKRADGGPTISNDSKLEAYRLRKEADKDNTGTKNFVDTQVPLGVGIGTMLGARGKIAKGIGALGALYGASNLNKAKERIDTKAARDDEIDRIEAGRAKPGEEDRKRGGRVSKSDSAVKIADDEESRAKGGRACRAEGGPVMGLKNAQGGSGGAAGRLAKIKMYGK